MRALESEITAVTPIDFPNRIDADGLPEDEFAKFVTIAKDLENQITEKLRTSEWLDHGPWLASVESARKSQKEELQFIDGADFLRPLRYLDRRSAVKVAYLKSRVEFLRLICAEIG